MVWKNIRRNSTIFFFYISFILPGLKSPLCRKSDFIKGLDWTFHLSELHGLHTFFQGLNIIGICCVLVTDYIFLSLHQESVAFFLVIFHFILNDPHLPIKKKSLIKITFKHNLPFRYPWTSSGKIAVQKAFMLVFTLSSQLCPEAPFPTHVWIGLSKIISVVGSWKILWV